MSFVDPYLFLLLVLPFITGVVAMGSILGKPWCHILWAVVRTPWRLFLVLAGEPLPVSHPNTCLCVPCREAYTKYTNDKLAEKYATKLRQEFEKEVMELLTDEWKTKYGPPDLDKNETISLSWCLLTEDCVRRLHRVRSCPLR